MQRSTLFTAAVCLALGSAAEATAQEAPALDGGMLAIRQGYLQTVGQDEVLNPAQTVQFSSDDEDDVSLFLSDEETRERLGNPLISQHATLAGHMNYRGLEVVGSLRSGTISNMSGLIPWAEAEVYVTEPSGVTFQDILDRDTPLSFDEEAADDDGYFETQAECHSFFFGMYVQPGGLFPGGGGPGPGSPGDPSEREIVHAAYLESLENGSLGVCLQQLAAANSAFDPVVGNPDSLQGAMLRSALELGGGENPFAEEPELLSFGFTRFDAGVFDGQRYDVRLQKAWPVFGGGTRLLLDLPVSLIDTGDDTAFSGHVGVGLEFPLIEGRWTLTPRTAFGIVSSDEVGGDGELWSASLASRYVVPNVGGGKLVIGNMVAHTATTETGLSGSNVNPDLANWVFRNGAAYQLPGGDWRVAYVFTNFTGDEVFLDEHHEVSVDYDGFERVRIGLKGTAGDDYEAVTLSAGLRF